jgi:hypothetical protein
MTTSPTAGQHWEQPSFDSEPARPFVTGPVLLPVVTRANLTALANVPAPGPEEQRLRAVRALVWPLAIVVCILTGSWWPMLIIPIAVSAILKNRLRELRRQRYVAAQLLR